tara:strand:- start:8517 stop:8903 length:387 start_codon:yes stop_codon:yes gene_type:complete
MLSKKIKIIDANDLQPLPQANVYHTNNTKIGVVSDFDGFANVQANDPNQSITISYQGYKTQRYPFSSLPPQIKLAMDVGQLDEVLIVAKKDKPKNTWVKPLIFIGLGLLLASSVGSAEEAPPIKTLPM